MPLTSSFIPSSADVERYKRWRGLARDLNHRIVQTIPREAMHQVGEAIGILRGGVLVLESEDQSSVLMDCCLYDWIREGKNLVEKCAESHPRRQEPRNTNSCRHICKPNTGWGSALPGAERGCLFRGHIVSRGTLHHGYWSKPNSTRRGLCHTHTPSGPALDDGWC